MKKNTNNLLLFFFYFGFIFILLCLTTIPRHMMAEANESGKELFFTILHTNDEHSALIPRGRAIDFHPQKENPTLGGYARLATVVNRFREDKEAKKEPVLLINAGDFMGGSAYSWLSLEGYAPELDIKQKIGYDLAIIGNHEFDNGPELLASYLKTAGYPEAHEKTPLLATNIDFGAGHPLEGAGIKKYYLMELDNGIVLGFFSLMGDEAQTVIVDAGSAKFQCQHETAREAVADLNAMGADIVIAVNHSGIDEDRQLAKAITGIDIIVGGHSHTIMDEPEVIGKTIIVQAGSLLRCLGILELAYNPDTGELRLCNNETETTTFMMPLDYTVPLDPYISSLIDYYTAELNTIVSRYTGGKVDDILKPVASSDFPLLNHPNIEENQMGNFVTDAMRLVVEDKTGTKVDFAVQGGGIIRGGLYPGSMDYSLGLISFYDLAETVGLGSDPDGRPGFPLASFYLTGEEVRRVMEVTALAAEYMGDNYFLQVSGLRLSYDPQRVILFWLPGFNLPIPSSRAVISAERYTGDGLQTVRDEDYAPLLRGDNTLYHIVTDYAILAAIPRIDKMVPWLGIKPKDRGGNIVENHEDLILQIDGDALRVWQVVVEHISNQSTGKLGLPHINDYYRETGDRINTTEAYNLMIWPLAVLFLLIVMVTLLVKVRRRKKHFISSE